MIRLFELFAGVGAVGVGAVGDGAPIMPAHAAGIGGSGYGAGVGAASGSGGNARKRGGGNSGLHERAARQILHECSLP